MTTDERARELFEALLAELDWGSRRDRPAGSLAELRGCFDEAARRGLGVLVVHG